VALDQTNIVVILAIPLLFVIIILNTLLLEQWCMCHIHFIHYGCDSIMKSVFLSEHIPTSRVEPWLVLVRAWKWQSST